MKELEALELKVKNYLRALLSAESAASEELLGGSEDSEDEVCLSQADLETAHYHFESSGDYDDYEDVDYEDHAEQLTRQHVQPSEHAGAVEDVPIVPVDERLNRLFGPVTVDWLTALQQAPLASFPNAEPTARSSACLRFLLSCDLSEGLAKLACVLGMRAVQALFHHSEQRFLNLVELCVVYRVMDDAVVAVALDLLGPRNVKRVIVKTIDRFPPYLVKYLEPLRDVPEGAHLIALWGPEFLSDYRRAVTRDLSRRRLSYSHVQALLEELTRPLDVLVKFGPYVKEMQDAFGKGVTDRVVKRAGLESWSWIFKQWPSIKRLTGYLGIDFMKQQIVGPGFSRVKRLFDLGDSIWEMILQEHVGTENLKREIIELHDSPKRFRQLHPIPQSAAVIELLGEARVRDLLRSHDQATLQLSVVGHLLELRSVVPSESDRINNAYVLEVLSLGARFPLVWEMVPRISQETPPGNSDQPYPDTEAWSEAATRLLEVLKRIQDAGFYPSPELILPILKAPEQAGARLQSYRKVREALGGIADPVVEDLLEFDEPADVVLTILHGILQGRMSGRLSSHNTLQMLREAFKYQRQGMRVPPLPRFAQPITLRVRESIVQQTKALDIEGLQRLQAELVGLADGVEGLTAAWQRTFDLCQSTGYPVDPDTRVRLQQDVAAGRPEEALQSIFRYVVRRYNRQVADMFVRLFLAYHLKGNADVLDRLRSEIGAQSVEALHELLTDRLTDLGGDLVVRFRNTMVEWLSLQQGTGVARLIERLGAATSLGGLHDILMSGGGTGVVPDMELVKLLHRLRKAFPLTADLLARYREFAQRECAKLRPMASGRMVNMMIRPSRGVINLFSGVYGEDCSVRPRFVGRLFHPRHVFYQLTMEGSALLQGYLSILQIRRGNELALMFDVMNPSNNMNLDAQDFLRQVVEALSKQAVVAGAKFVGCADQWARISNRSSLTKAAQELYAHCAIEQGFILEPPADCFQSIGGDLRVLFKSEAPDCRNRL